ncbi:MAG TPA: cation diffusion facilitator family transporter [Nitrososphaeraceae archaeon]|nr:cation diffusion facilitator family transporter [Nitrososphaeraceae archaeon]
MSTTRDELTKQRIKKLRTVFYLVAGFVGVEVVSGILTGSLALLADAGHMVADVGGLALALFAISYSRRPPTPQRTFGFYRLEILAALANGIVLILISFYILYEAYWRIVEPRQIDVLPMLVVACIGLLVNIGGIILLKSHSHNISLNSDERNEHTLENRSKNDTNLNMQGAYLEVLSDTLGSVGIIVSGIIIYLTGFYLADPIVSIGLALFIFPRIWRLLNKSLHILMEGVPANVSHEEVKNAILQIKGVTGIFELHIWTITSGLNALSAHVVVIDPSKSLEVLQEINSLLEKNYRIAHATIQIEGYHDQTGSI